MSRQARRGRAYRETLLLSVDGLGNIGLRGIETPHFALLRFCYIFVIRDMFYKIHNENSESFSISSNDKQRFL